MTDLAEVSVKSHFGYEIGNYFRATLPKTIIETGLYHGTGSTSLITSLIRDIPLDADFYSIECNEKNIKIAEYNLSQDGLIDHVEIHSGLSVPHLLIPSIEETIEDIRTARKIGMYVDHEIDDSSFYTKETSNYEEDDILGKLLKYLSGEVDFLLLDSAGHMGFIEFKYVLPLIKTPCAIALDDIKHLKHYRSLEMIKNDKRFKLIHENDEKFGSAIALFTP